MIWWLQRFLYKESHTGRARLNKDKKSKAQTTLEATLGLIAAMMFFAGVIRLFFWLNNSMVTRQIAYYETRDLEVEDFMNIKSNGKIGEAKKDADVIFFYQPSKFRILGESEK